MQSNNNNNKKEKITRNGGKIDIISIILDNKIACGEKMELVFFVRRHLCGAFVRVTHAC